MFSFCLRKVRILFQIKANRNAIFQWKDHSQMYFVYFFFFLLRTKLQQNLATVYCILYHFSFSYKELLSLFLVRSCSQHFAQFCTCKTKVQYIQSKEAWDEKIKKIFNFMLDFLNGNVLRVSKCLSCLFLFFFK